MTARHPYRSEDVYRELSGELKRLASVHDIGEELIEQSRDLGQLFEAVVEEYRATTSDDESDAADRLQALVHFAADVPALRSGERGDVDAELHQHFDQMGALCHSINNPLTAALGRAQLLRAMRKDDEKLIQTAKTIRQRSFPSSPMKRFRRPSRWCWKAGRSRYRTRRA